MIAAIVVVVLGGGAADGGSYSSSPSSKISNTVDAVKSKLQGVPRACPSDVPEGMVCIPGGAFERGAPEAHTCAQPENRKIKTKFSPKVRAEIPTFFMDQTEVTIAAYRDCVRGKKCTRGGPLYTDFSRPAQPVTAISWFQAAAFCKAYNKRLPTESEWEFAARDDRPPQCPEVIVKSEDGRSCGTKKKGKHGATGRVLEVKTTPANGFGLYEMRGNAEEWVDDWFVADFSKCKSCQGKNPRGPCAGRKKCKRYPLKLVKGGSWYWPGDHATAWHRRPWRPSNKPAHHFGFRCAKDL